MDDIVKILKDVFAEAKERSSNKFLSSIILSILILNHNAIIDLAWYGYLGSSHTKYYLGKILYSYNTLFGILIGFSWALFSNWVLMSLEHFKHCRIDESITNKWHTIQKAKAEKDFDIATIKSGTRSLEEANKKLNTLESSLESLKIDSEKIINSLKLETEEKANKIRINEGQILSLQERISSILSEFEISKRMYDDAHKEEGVLRKLVIGQRALLDEFETNIADKIKSFILLAKMNLSGNAKFDKIISEFNPIQSSIAEINRKKQELYAENGIILNQTDQTPANLE